MNYTDITSLPAWIVLHARLNILKCDYAPLDEIGTCFLAPDQEDLFGLPLTMGYQDLLEYFNGKFVFKSTVELRKQITEKNVVDRQKMKSLAFHIDALGAIKVPMIDLGTAMTVDEMIQSMTNIVQSLNFEDSSQTNTYVSYSSIMGDHMDPYLQEVVFESLDEIIVASLNRMFVDSILMPKLKGYIDTLYDQNSASGGVLGWKMYEENIGETRRILSFILRRIEKVSVENCVSLMTQFVNGILNCPTGQMEALNTLAFSVVDVPIEPIVLDHTEIATAVIGQTETTVEENVKAPFDSVKVITTDNFLGHLHHQIMLLKNYWFQCAVLSVSRDNVHNVHILNHYRKTLKEKLGLIDSMDTYIDRIRIVGEDPFGGNENAVLYKIFEILTPKQLQHDLMKSVETVTDRHMKAELRSIKKDSNRHAEISQQLQQVTQERPITTPIVVAYLYNKGLLEEESSWQRFFDYDPCEADEKAVLTPAGMMEILKIENLVFDNQVDLSSRDYVQAMRENRALAFSV